MRTTLGVGALPEVGIFLPEVGEVKLPKIVWELDLTADHQRAILGEEV